MMNLREINANEYLKPIKCTVHSTGKLGFSDGAQSWMGLSDNGSILIAIDESDEKLQNMFIRVLESQPPSAFKIAKAGMYYYVNTRNFFQQIGLPFTSGKIIYDITEISYNGQKWFKLTIRQKKNKKEVKLEEEE